MTVYGWPSISISRRMGLSNFVAIAVLLEVLPVDCAIRSEHIVNVPDAKMLMNGGALDHTDGLECVIRGLEHPLDV